MLRKILAAAALLSIITLVVFDSRIHFSSELVRLKSEKFSSQKNWNLFFDQSYVYYSGGLNLHSDIKELNSVLQRDDIVVSDIATSYYLVANLPVHIVNVHRHHGRYRFEKWSEMLDSGRICRLSQDQNLEELDAILDGRLGQSESIYLVINKSQGNRNFVRDCLSSNRGYLISTAQALFEQRFENQSFVVFDLSSRSS